MEKEFYVYVYIDPRDSKEFYIGKGKDNRKNEHLSDKRDTDKVNRIIEIKKEGREPIIRVVARNLTEEQAFLVEKTLIWKLGKNLTNISSGGNYSDNFRPDNTLKYELPGYDFENGIYYVNVSEGEHRCWDDCKSYGFLSAGQDKKYSKYFNVFKKGDIVIAYFNHSKIRGYVGIGRVIDETKKINDFLYNGLKLNQVTLKQDKIFTNSENDKSEYLVKVEWIKTVDIKDAKWNKKIGLFTNPRVVASLEFEKQKITKEFLEKEFDIKFRDLYLSRIEMD